MNRFILGAFLAMLGSTATAYQGVPAPDAPAAPVPDTQCGPLKAMLAALLTQYQELPVSTGLVPGQGLMVLTISSRGATFTLLIVKAPATPGAEAIACVIADGTNWAIVTPSTAPAPDAPPKPLRPRRPLITPVEPDEGI